ncbi:hypothetical protein ACFL40_05095 [candidate division KSB1 bacterium]
MNKLNKFLFVITTGALVIFQQNLYAQANVKSEVIPGGNESGSNTMFKVSGTAGEPASGSASSSSYTVLSGFSEQAVSGSGQEGVITVRLIDSGGSGIVGGTVQYYDGGWLSAGTTDQDGTCLINYTGTQTKLSFEMTYAGYTQRKSDQDFSNDVVFQTINMIVSLKTSAGTSAEGIEVQYYTSEWLVFGTTGADGNTSGKELLPGAYSFKITYAGYTQQKSDINISNTNPLEILTYILSPGNPDAVDNPDDGGGYVKLIFEASPNHPGMSGDTDDKLTMDYYLVYRNNTDTSFQRAVEWATISASQLSSEENSTISAIVNTQGDNGNAYYWVAAVQGDYPSGIPGAEILNKTAVPPNNEISLFGKIKKMVNKIRKKASVSRIISPPSNRNKARPIDNNTANLSNGANFNGDSSVDILDIGIILDILDNLSEYDPVMDLNNDGNVDVFDIGRILDVLQ